MLPINLLIIGPEAVLMLPKDKIKIYTNSNENYSYSAVREWNFLLTICDIPHKKLNIVVQTDKRKLFFQ